MEEDLYDEFGNYIGPEIRSGEYDSDEDHPRNQMHSSDEEDSEVVVSKSKFLNYGSHK
jgi:U5 small nuclear ribonucleoprotein component